ncbi:sulfotransferase [Streptomyces canus]|uniref:sulfotransferase n=1 Tax=Streptomyces canus TaxID=58343 RepID=UPI003693C089
MSQLPPVFVVSTGRCGSTLLSEMLRLNPEVLSLSEFFGLLLTGPFPAGELTAAEYWSLLSTPHPFVTSAYRVGAPVEEFLYEASPSRPFNASTGIPPILVTSLPHLTDRPEALYAEVEEFVRSLGTAEVAEQHRRLFGWLRDRFGAKVWAERSGFSLRHVPELVRLFPDARFVHLYRDGRECAYSMSRSGAFRLGAVSMRLQQELGVNPYVEDVPPGMSIPADLVPLMPGTFELSAFESVELPVEDFGHAWSDQITTGLEGLREVEPGRLLQFSYDRLVEDTAGTLTELAAFIGPVDASDSWLRKAAGLVSDRPSGWRSLPDEQRQRLEAACQDAMSRLAG